MMPELTTATGRFRVAALATAIVAGCGVDVMVDVRPGAAVTGVADTSVAWSVEPAGCGAVSPAGLFTAPASAATCVVRATARAAPSVSDTANVSVVPAGQRWAPTPGLSWQWQLTGTLDTSLDVHAYDIDLFDNSAVTIAALQALGRKVICYFSAGSYEDWRPDASAFPAAALGNDLAGWPGERWLDTRSQAVRDIMSARLDLAVQKACDAVEPDNVDGYANGSGFPLTAATQLDYNRFLAAAAHARNLSVALKNDLDQVRDLLGEFDFALVEECFKYNECNLAEPFIAAGKAVLEVEYGGQTKADNICPQANALNFDALVKNLNLDAFRIACR